MYPRKQIEGLKSSLNIDIDKRVIEHRNRFFSIIRYRYRELLPYLIQYDNIEETSINQVKLEHALRNGYHIAVGRAKNNKIMVLGYVKRHHNYKYDFYDYYRHTDEDIKYTIPEEFRPEKEILEIQEFDDCKTGDFIIITNKAINYQSDMYIVDHYAEELAEIVLSRFSLAIQSKINTVFLGQHNDESINQLVQKIYNGSPFVKVSNQFDVTDGVLTLETGNIGMLFPVLKSEYQNKISELNNMLGINSLAVEKDSGISDVEAKSNRGYTSSNSNIYIESRQNELDKLNKRFNLNLVARYNDETRSEIAGIGGDMFDDNNNDNI